MNQLIRVIFLGESDIVALAVSHAGNTGTLLHLVSRCLIKPHKLCQLLPMAARFEMIFAHFYNSHIRDHFSHSLEPCYIIYLIENDIVFLPLSSNMLFISKHKHKCLTHVKIASNYPVVRNMLHQNMMWNQEETSTGANLMVLGVSEWPRQCNLLLLAKFWSRCVRPCI